MCVYGKGVLGVDLVRYGCLPQRDIPQSVEDYSDAGHSHIVFVTLLCYISQSPINSLHCLQDYERRDRARGEISQQLAQNLILLCMCSIGHPKLGVYHNPGITYPGNGTT